MRRHLLKRVLLVVSIMMLVSSSLIFGPLSNTARAGMTWLIETVDAQAGWLSSIAVDSGGNPWILYEGDHFGSRGLVLAHWTGSSWAFQSIMNGIGDCLSLSLDSLNRPHAVYDFDDSVPFKRDMHYAYWNGISWVYETIDSQGDLGSTCSIALDSLGRPHASYENYTWTAMNPRRDLKYAWRDSSGWHNETVDWRGWVGKGNTIAVDSLNRPHIAYEDVNNYTLKYAWWDGSKWNIEVPDPSGEVIPDTPASIRMDSLDRPHIAYMAGVTLRPGQLRYASWNGASWTIEPAALINSPGPYDSVSLRLDSLDGPSIAYTNHSFGLSFTSKQGSSWIVENIEQDAGVGASLALDSGGNPHISYGDLVVLKYAHRGMDSSPPSSNVDAINPYWASSPRVITATATDAQSRVSNVTLWYRYSPDNASTTWGPWKAYQKVEAPSWYWFFTFPDGEGYYQFYSVAVDTGGNVEPPPPAADAVAAFEQTKPSSILQPVPSYWFNSTPLDLTATASDAPSGVDGVDLYYSFSGNNASWDAWTLYQTDRAPPWSWGFNFPKGAGWYRLYSLARDWAGNVEDTPASHDLELAFDRTPPMSMVNPISGEWHRSSVDVTARASDSRSGVANVALGYRHSPDEVSWSPWTCFQTDPLPPWSWLFTFPDGDGFYQFHSIGTDNASNSEWFKDWPEANTTYDATPPTAIIDQSPPYWKNASTILTATVSDAMSGVENVTLWNRFSLDNSSWGSWQSFATDISPSWSWLFDFPDGPGHYRFQATAFDVAGNEDLLAQVQEAEVGFDPEAPSASLTVGFPSVSDPPVTWVTSSTTLNLTAHDDNGSGVAIIRDRTWYGGWSLWSDYSVEFALAGADGLRYLEFQAFDLAGNSGLVENRTIVLDSTPPTSALSIGNPKYLVGGNFINHSTPMTLQAVDGEASPVGLNLTFYRTNGGSWNAYSSSFFLDGEGPHIVEYRSYDLLANGEAVLSTQVILDDTPPATTISPATGEFNVTTTFTLTANDGGSGVKVTRHRIDGGGWIDYSGGFTLPEELHNISYYSKDNLDNTEQEKWLEVNVQGPPPPNTPPSVTLNAPVGGEEWLRGSSQTIDWTMHDGQDANANLTVYVNYTTAGGTHSIVAGLKGVESFLWILLDAEATDVVVNVTVIDTGGLKGCDQSGPFTVKAPPPTEIAVNYKPLVALVFAVILAVAGIWSSKRRPWKAGRDSMVVAKRFLAMSMPFVLAETATGAVSLLMGELRIPPFIGIGALIDVTILVIGLLVTIYTGLKSREEDKRTSQVDT